MASPIGSSTSLPHSLPISHTAPQVKPTGKDSDGDNDGSKPGEVEQPATSAKSVGAIINAKA